MDSGYTTGQWSDATVFRRGWPILCVSQPSHADYKRFSEIAWHLKPDLNAVTWLPAPKLEPLGWLVTSPFDRLGPASFGPIAPWWEHRCC